MKLLYCLPSLCLLFSGNILLWRSDTMQVPEKKPVRWDFEEIIMDENPLQPKRITDVTGKFIKPYWYQAGKEHGNPKFNNRIRVNAPEVVLHPDFGKRIEVRGNGMIQILTEEPLDQIAAAYLYLEMWGGHPGTANKRVIVNGRNTYPIPEVGTAAGNCTYQYPLIPLKITDLVNGYNAFQFACDNGTSFWGHFLIDNACLQLVLKNEHPALNTAGLQEFTAMVTSAGQNEDAIKLQLQTNDVSKIAKVEYHGYYIGFDDNGNNLERDWHGYTKNKLPENIIGSSDTPPFSVTWSISMLPAQNEVSVKAVIHFKNNDILYMTPETRGLQVPVRPDVQVNQFKSYDMPYPFWSRANRLNTCTIYADVIPDEIEKAELHILIWDGGEGTVEDHFKFNNQPLQLASRQHAHDVIYRIFEVDPAMIKTGENEIELLSDTEHHGIEVLLPGPLLVVRSHR